MLLTTVPMHSKAAPTAIPAAWAALTASVSPRALDVAPASSHLDIALAAMISSAVHLLLVRLLREVELVCRLQSAPILPTLGIAQVPRTSSAACPAGGEAMTPASTLAPPRKPPSTTWDLMVLTF